MSGTVPTGPHDPGDLSGKYDQTDPESVNDKQETRESNQEAFPRIQKLLEEEAALEVLKDTVGTLNEKEKKEKEPPTEKQPAPGASNGKKNPSLNQTEGTQGKGQPTGPGQQKAGTIGGDPSAQGSQSTNGSQAAGKEHYEELKELMEKYVCLLKEMTELKTDELKKRSEQALGRIIAKMKDIAAESKEVLQAIENHAKKAKLDVTKDIIGNIGKNAKQDLKLTEEAAKRTLHHAIIKDAERRKQEEKKSWVDQLKFYWQNSNQV